MSFFPESKLVCTNIDKICVRLKSGLVRSFDLARFECVPFLIIIGWIGLFYVFFFFST